MHLRLTFLVEKWVRPSDLTEGERGVYETEQKRKEEERQQRLKLQQQRREQEEREKEREEEQKCEKKEKEHSLLAAAAAAEQGGKNVKSAELKGEESAAKLVSNTPSMILPTATVPTATTKTNDIITARTETDRSEVATGMSSLEFEQTQTLSQGGGEEDTSNPAPPPPGPTSPMDKAQGLLEQTQDSLTGSKRATQLAPDTTKPLNAHQNMPEQKDASPKSNKFVSREVAPVYSSISVNPSVMKPPAEESLQQQQQQQQQKQKLPGDGDISVSTEPLAKKPRVE